MKQAHRVRAFRPGLRLPRIQQQRHLPSPIEGHVHHLPDLMPNREMDLKDRSIDRKSNRLGFLFGRWGFYYHPVRLLLFLSIIVSVEFVNGDSEDQRISQEETSLDMVHYPSCSSTSKGRMLMCICICLCIYVDVDVDVYVYM